MRKNITEPGDNNLKPCNFNAILIIESVRYIPTVTTSKSIGGTNPVHLIVLIKYANSARKGDATSETTCPDGTSKNISVKYHIKNSFPSGYEKTDKKTRKNYQYKPKNET